MPSLPLAQQRLSEQYIAQSIKRHRDPVVLSEGDSWFSFPGHWNTVDHLDDQCLIVTHGYDYAQPSGKPTTFWLWPIPAKKIAKTFHAVLKQQLPSPLWLDMMERRLNL